MHKEYCAFAIHAVLTFHKTQELLKFPADWPNPKTALFVTWNKTLNHELRGCIGTFEPDLLSIVLPRYALISAFKDTRFSPIDVPELS